MRVDSALLRRLTILTWVCAFGALALLIADHFKLGTVWVNVSMPDGSIMKLADGFATVDHPFHTARSISLLESIRDGHLLRWFGQHQGGYPAEFYPTGAAWLDVVLWALTFGQLPMEFVHKLLIALIVFAPALIYLWWAIRERISPGVALLAGTGHAVIAGEWWSGGWTEVALWGLVTNVAAQTAIVGALLGVSGWIREGRRRDLAIAGIAIGIAIGTNPRTFIALAAVGLASLIVAFLQRPEIPIKLLALRIAALGGLSFVLSAPELISLARYQDHYFFVHYSDYADVNAWWDSSNTALWTPIFALALGGIVTSLALPNRPLMRTVGLTAVIYMGFMVGIILWGGSVVEQLELTRLMPFQRMILFFLAALFINDVLGFFRRHIPSAAPQATGVVLAVLALLLAWVVVIRPASWVRADEMGLQTVPSSAQAPVGDLKLAVQKADETAYPGTSILVLGSVLSWHEPLDATNWSDRRFFYDDWLWYWQKFNFGEYDPETEHAYPVDTSTLNPEYLQTHGIGAVIVADVAGQQNRAIAAQSPLLTEVSRGAWYDVYTVNSPTPIVTAGSAPASNIEVTNQTITASGTSDGSPIVVRQNWFPRWHATMNGKSAAITQRSDGDMEIVGPAGDYYLRVEYTVTNIDWLSRFLFVIGLISLVCLFLGSRLNRLPGFSRVTQRASTLFPESARPSVKS
ncbi:hypothetical protein BH09CHL1_BH09CHL1_05850 [soil metagenome]